MELEKIAPYYKAVAGALIPFFTALGVSLTDGTLTAQDWISAVLALLVGGGVVFAVPNIKSNYPPEEPPESEPPYIAPTKTITKTTPRKGTTRK